MVGRLDTKDGKSEKEEKERKTEGKAAGIVVYDSEGK